MRLIRPRLTVRSLMVVVLGIGVALTSGMQVERLRRIARHRQARVVYFRDLEARYTATHKLIQKNLEKAKASRSRTGQRMYSKMALDSSIQLQQVAKLRRRWEYAAARPWVSSPPDQYFGYLTGRPYFHIDKGNYREALADLEELHRRYPENASLFNLHAWLLATCPDGRFRDGKRAVTLAKQACELSPKMSPAILDTLAAAYAEAGDFAAAKRTEQKALELTPSNDPERQDYFNRLTLFKSKKPYRIEPPPE